MWSSSTASSIWVFCSYYSYPRTGAVLYKSDTCRKMRKLKRLEAEEQCDCKKEETKKNKHFIQRTPVVSGATIEMALWVIVSKQQFRGYIVPGNNYTMSSGFCIYTIIWYIALSYKWHLLRGVLMASYMCRLTPKTYPYSNQCIVCCSEMLLSDTLSVYVLSLAGAIQRPSQ